MNFPLNNKTDFFFEIVENIIPYTHIYDDFSEYLKITQLDKIDFINQSFLYDIKFSSFNISKKYNVMYKWHSNLFLTKEKREQLMDYFNISQKILFSFKKLGQIIKYRKFKHYCSETDLCLEPLSNINSRFIISISQGETIYKFRIHDLVRLIENGLIYAPDLFSDPQLAKNPYTNLEFTICDLYQIYFHMVEIKMKIPTIFHLYYVSGFDITVLMNNYEAILRDKSIQKNTEDMEDEDKYDEIMDMLDRHKRFVKSIVIHDNFPIKKVVDHFQHILSDFMFSKYSYNPILKLKKRRIIIKKLIEINKETPAFGRNIIRYRRRVSDISGNLFAPIINDNLLITRNIIMDGADNTEDIENIEDTEDTGSDNEYENNNMNDIYVLGIGVGNINDASEIIDISDSDTDSDSYTDLQDDVDTNDNNINNR